MHGRCLANCLLRGFASIPAGGAVVIEFLGKVGERSEDRWVDRQTGRQVERGKARKDLPLPFHRGERRAVYSPVRLQTAYRYKHKGNAKSDKC